MLHLPTCNVMNIVLVQTAWFVLYSQQEMIQWLWAMSWRIHPRVPESNEDRWSMVTTTTNCIKGVHTLLFEWHTQWQLRKAFNKQYKQQISCTKISFNIPSNINKQTTNNIMQDHAKQRYIFGHLSLIQSLALDIPSGVTTVRDLDKKCPSKKRFGYLLEHLSFWVSGMELSLIFVYIKK